MADKNIKVNMEEKQESSTGGSNLLHENYLKLKKVAEGILTERFNYMKLRAPGFMDLVIEKIWNNRISLSHYYEQNGDLMADPDMELIVDHDNETLRAATFQQDNMGIYHTAYKEDELVDDYLAKELDEFLGQWLKNILAQGHIPYKANYASEMLSEAGGVRFDEDGHEIEPDYLEDDDLEM
ncbi:MAG: hypothetical protein PF505_02650 [Vallitaleaceae bacterium]|nr:hypothetical protein [Vallitaleaceae bacterium]